MKCSKCGKKAVYFAKYNGLYLCKDHFNEMVEKRVKRDLRKQIDLNKNLVRISVALSGGKDSSTTLYLIKNILGNRRNIKITAFTVDEGISGYREYGLKSAEKLCNDLGIDHKVIKFKDNFNLTLDEIIKNDEEKIPCSYCGPMRRSLINKMAMIQDADYVALGLNLDDYSQSILMNVVKGDFDRMMRMSPQSNQKEGMVKRIAPLRSVPEKEVLLYAFINGITFDSSWCPYYDRAQRNIFRDIVNKLSEENPSSKFSILKFLDTMRENVPQYKKDAKINKCRICGSPTNGDICATCSELENLKIKYGSEITSETARAEQKNSKTV